MQIKLLKSTNCDGKTYAAGDVVKDASRKDAQFLINIGFAVEYVEPKKPKAKAPARKTKMVDVDDLETR